jgi:NTE family protein
MKKLALVLSGGGFKGAFQLGALEYIRDNWQDFLVAIHADDRSISADRTHLHFDIVSGVSVGSLNGFLVAMNRFDKLVELWEEVEQKGSGMIYTSDLITTNPQTSSISIKTSFSALRKRFPLTMRNLLLNIIFNQKKISRDLKKDFDNFRSVADNSPLLKKLLSLRQQGKPRSLIDAIADNNCLYKCGFVPLDTGMYQSPFAHEFADDTQLCNAVLASTSMPVVWSPVAEVITTNQIHKDCVDGGIVDVSPLGDVIKEINKQGDNDEYTIIIINSSNGQTEFDPHVRNIAQIAVRSLTDIAITEIFNNDLREFLNTNSILQQQGLNEITYEYFNWTTGTTTHKRRKRFNAIVIQPETTLGDTLQSTPEAIQSRRRAGMIRAEKVMGEVVGVRKVLK